MRRILPSLYVVAAILLTAAFSATAAHSQSELLDQHLREQCQGKTLLLRGFYSGDRLQYDASGVPTGQATSGDWTSDGFVVVDDVRSSDQGFVMEARRLLVVTLDNKFSFRAAETTDADKKTKPILVAIEVDLGMHNPAPEQADAALSRIFLTTQDDLRDLVPDYWRPCVPVGLIGQDDTCHFSREVLAIPGVTPSGKSGTTATAGGEESKPEEVAFYVGKESVRRRQFLRRSRSSVKARGR